MESKLNQELHNASLMQLDIFDWFKNKSIKRIKCLGDCNREIILKWSHTKKIYTGNRLCRPRKNTMKAKFWSA